MKKKITSLILAFVILLGFIPISNIAQAESETVRIVNTNSTEVLGTLKIPIHEIREDALPDNGSSGTYVGGVREHTDHTGIDGRPFICIEAGVAVGIYYKRVKAYTNNEVAAFIAYAENNNYSRDTIQAGIWTILGQIDISSTYKGKYDAFVSEYKKNPDASVFKGATVSEYHSTQNPVLQRLISWDFEKEEKGKLSLQKSSSGKSLTDLAELGYSLAGAEYELYKNVADANAKRKPIAKFVAKEDGTTNEVEIEQGRYFAKETKAPKGFFLDNEIHPVEVKAGETNVFQVKDKPKFDPLSLMLKKENQAGEPVKDAEFEVKYYNGQLTKSEIEKATPVRTWIFKTNESGIFAFHDNFKIGGDDLFKFNGRPVGLIGTYTFKEIKAPKGYILNEDLFVGYVKESGEIVKPGEQGTVYQEPQVLNKTQKMKFTLQKQDVITGSSQGDASLQGAEYNIVALEDTATHKKGDTVKTVTTDAKGKVEVSLDEVGKYAVVEVKESDGYNLNPLAITVVGEADGTGNEYTSLVTQTTTNAKPLVELLNQKIKDLNTLTIMVESKYQI